MSPSISRKTKLNIYKTYIRPKMEYATIIFDGNLNQKQIDDYENKQRSAILCATKAYRHTSHEKLLHEVGIEPLSLRRKYFSLCHLFKITVGLAPSYLYNLLPPRVHEVTAYPLRNMQDFAVPKVSKNYIKLSFFWKVLYS